LGTDETTGALRFRSPSSPLFPFVPSLLHHLTLHRYCIDRLFHHSYNPGFAHPVYQPFLPPELAGKADFLKDDSSIEGRTFDEAALREWEWKMQGGEKWSGREELAERMRVLGEEEGKAKRAGDSGGVA
jgi:hypothetical protein